MPPSKAPVVAFPLVEAARVVGGYAWLEERLFELLGGWVPKVAEPEVKLRLAADSYHHAWHASLWRDRLPVLRELEAVPFVAPPGPEVVAWLDAAAAAPTTLEKLVGLYQVLLPRQIAVYRRHLEQASPVTDGPTIRALTLVLADEQADQAEGERLLQAVQGVQAVQAVQGVQAAKTAKAAKAAKA